MVGRGWGGFLLIKEILRNTYGNMYSKKIDFQWLKILDLSINIDNGYFHLKQAYMTIKLHIGTININN